MLLRKGEVQVSNTNRTQVIHLDSQPDITKEIETSPNYQCSLHNGIQRIQNISEKEKEKKKKRKKKIKPGHSTKATSTMDPNNANQS